MFLVLCFLFINEHLANELSEGHDDAHAYSGGSYVEDDSGGLNLEKED